MGELDLATVTQKKQSPSDAMSRTVSTPELRELDIDVDE